MFKPQYILGAALCFIVGVFSVWLFTLTSPSLVPPETATETIETDKIETVDIATDPEPVQESDNPLDKIWEKSDHLRYLGYDIVRDCSFARDNCYLTIRKGRRVLDQFESACGDPGWLQVGLFDFIRSREKQLIVHTYSGGAHCCDDYAIYDLRPTFRKLYDSRLHDSGGDVGDELLPIDLDGDGVYEFRQNVMAFDYWFDSHAGSTFPPAVFRYDAKTGRYLIANRRFSGFVKAELDSVLQDDNLTNAKEASLRDRILYLIYAGEKDQAWKIYQRDYNFPERQRFKRELENILAQDPTYHAIYSVK